MPSKSRPLRRLPLIRVALTSALLAAPCVMLAQPAQADEGADRYALVGPNANIFCSSLTPAGDGPLKAGPGFVIFNAHDDVVSALVVLRHAEPNAEYPVRLLQGGAGEDCFTVDGILRTNRQGNGTLNLKEADVGRRAQVIVDSGDIFDRPTYRATRFFVTD